MSLFLLLQSDNEVPSSFAVEHWSRNGVLKNRWDNKVSSLSWEWLSHGGCGIAEFTVTDVYTAFTIEPDDDIRIYQKNVSGTGGRIVYRGFITDFDRSMAQGESITISCNGYFFKLSRYVVNDDGAPKTYENMGLDGILEDILDNFVIPNSTPAIAKGTIDSSLFAPDSIEFKSSALDSIKTLAQLSDPPVEYGIDEDLRFFWRTESKTTNHRFFVGKDIASYSERVETDSVVNKIYFEGNTSGGVVFTATGSASDSQTAYGLRESILSNSSINTSSTAAQIMTAFLKENSAPKTKIKMFIPRTATKFEDNAPMGSVMIVNPSTNQTSNKWGTALNGGSGLVWGTAANGGSGKKWGTNRYYQIHRVKYALTNEDGYCDIELELGGSRYDTPALINQLEANIEAARQRQI